MRCMMRECIHDSGDYREIDFYPVRKIGKSRKAKAKPSSETQKKLNKRNAARNLTWLIQENFGTRDFALRLSYPTEINVDYGKAEKYLKNYLRRLRRKFKQHNEELKYITVTEIGSKNRHLHHHLIISGALGKDILLDEWIKVFPQCKGRYTNAEHLVFTRTGLSATAFYFTKDPLHYRSYNSSRNLRHPEPQKKDGKISKKKVEELRQDIFNRDEFEKLYPGYEFVDADPYWDMYGIDENGEIDKLDFPYLTVRMFRKDSKYILRDKDRVI